MATVVEVRRRLDESIARFWSDTELQDWLDEGAAEVARRTETRELIALLGVSSGTEEYNLPADLLRGHAMLYQTRDGFVRHLRYRDDLIARASSGDPLFYTIWGYPPTLTVWPIPSRDSTIYVLYYGTGTDVPVGWDDILLDYCEYRALRKDADPRWTEAKALFETKLAFMIDTTRKWTDQAGQFWEQGWNEFPFEPIFVAGGGQWDVDLWDQGVWG